MADGRGLTGAAARVRLHQGRRQHDSEADGCDGQGCRVVDGRRYAAGVSGASPAAAVCVLPAAVCAGDEPGDRSAARGDRGVSCIRGLGPWAHLLDKHAPLPGISLESPFLSLGQVAALRAGKYPHADELRLEELPCLYSPEMTLEQAIDELCEQRGGAGARAARGCCC